MPAPFSQSRLLFATLLSAAGASAQPQALTLADALARAAERNPGLAAHAHAERAADALIEQARLRPNPSLELEAENFAGSGALQGVRRLEATVQGRQVIERSGKRERRVAVASRDRELAAAEFALARAEVLAATAIAFVEALAAQERLALARQPAALAQEVVAATERRIRAGETSAADSARARAALAGSRGEVARAEAELDAARARLAAAWGGEAADVPPLRGRLALPESVPAALAADRLGAHPRVAHQQALVAVRRAALDLERARASQDVAVAGGVRFLREGSDAGLVAGLSVPLPTRDRNQGSIRAARENLAGAEQRVRAIEAELRSELFAATRELAATHAAALHLRREAVPALEEAGALLRAAYERGEVPLPDVLDAQRELVALRRELLQLERAFAVAHIRAEALVDSALPASSALFSR